MTASLMVDLKDVLTVELKVAWKVVLMVDSWDSHLVVPRVLLGVAMKEPVRVGLMALRMVDLLGIPMADSKAVL